MNEEPSPADHSEDEPSVFGNLPRSRPGARSPRRDESPAKGRRAATGSASASARKTEARAASAPPRDEPPPISEPERPETDRGGIEELAWAGVAAAAEAATLGVRLANRALGSLRGGPGKP